VAAKANGAAAGCAGEYPEKPITKSILMEVEISVIIPCYKQGRYLGEAIDSVLNQGHPSVEVIVVNDGSPDETESVARSYGDRIVYIAQENRGPAAARNSGIRAARGRYIAFLDSDDLYLPGTIERLYRYLETHPETALVCGDVYYYDGKQTTGLFSENIGRPHHIQNFRWETVNYCPPMNTIMLRREVFDHVPLFDENLRNAAEDWLMWVRIARLYNMAYLDEPLALYRQHGENTTNQVELLLAQNRYAAKLLVESPEFARYPGFYRAKLLYYRTATAWRTESKAAVAVLLLRAILTDPRQIGYGLQVFQKGLSNQRRRAQATPAKSAA
jgi:glycosyltransferase involved in cell wall biosynthesis